MNTPAHFWGLPESPTSWSGNARLPSFPNSRPAAVPSAPSSHWQHQSPPTPSASASESPYGSPPPDSACIPHIQPLLKHPHSSTPWLSSAICPEANEPDPQSPLRAVSRGRTPPPPWSALPQATSANFPSSSSIGATASGCDLVGSDPDWLQHTIEWGNSEDFSFTRGSEVGRRTGGKNAQRE